MYLNKVFYTTPIEVQTYLLITSSKSKILVLKNIKSTTSFFIKIPNNIFISIKNESNFFFSSFSLESLHIFLRNLSKQVSILRFPFFIKLLLKGLGFRIKLITQNSTRFLEFKLGFSHSINFKVIPSNILVVVKKNALILSGFFRTEIGNVANQIYNLRRPNVYTGKGFRYKRVLLKLKEVKKT